jgi:hypothetical protein
MLPANPRPRMVEAKWMEGNPSEHDDNNDSEQKTRESFQQQEKSASNFGSMMMKHCPPKLFTGPLVFGVANLRHLAKFYPLK